MNMFRKEYAKNTVNMHGDLDDVELLMAVEETFDIQISDREAEAVRTVGDLYDLVCSKIEHDSKAACHSAHAFRRLRNASLAAAVPMRPSTHISELRGDFSAEDWCRTMSKRTGLDFDLPEWLPGVPYAFAALIFFPLIAVWVSWSDFGVGALLWLSLWLLFPVFRFAPTRLPQQIKTVADLVRRSMGRNYTQLRDAAGSGNRSDIWLAICGLTREHTGHDGPIDRETTFFASQS